MVVGAFLMNFIIFFIALSKIQHRINWKWAFMNIRLLFKKKVVVRPHIQHYTSKQGSDQFYLLKTYKCSHSRHFKLISGAYTTIVPDSEVHDINGKPLTKNL